MAKTKDQLEQEITELKSQVKEQVETEQNEKSAKQLYGIYNSYIEAGFNADQAWDLFTIMVKNGTKPRGLFGGV